MERAKSNGDFPPHIEAEWTKNLNALPDILPPPKVVSDELYLRFALGLFTDFLVRRKDEKVLKLIYKDPFDHKDPRGCVYEDNGRYYAVRFEDHGDQLRMHSAVPLAGLRPKGGSSKLSPQ